MKLSESLNWFEESKLKELADYLAMKQVLRELDVGDLEGDATFWGSNPKITFFASEWDESRTFRALADRLLPKVGALSKQFDEQTGSLSLVGFFKGTAIIIRGSAPSTCKIVQVEEEVEIPEVPFEKARTEIVTRYKLEGECNPLMEEEDDPSTDEATDSN